LPWRASPQLFVALATSVSRQHAWTNVTGGQLYHQQSADLTRFNKLNLATGYHYRFDQAVAFGVQSMYIDALTRHYSPQFN
jgi:hypothetical protein